MYNGEIKSVMAKIPEVDVLTKWIKAEKKNREDWGKVKDCFKYQKVMPVSQLLVKGLIVLCNAM